MYIFSLSLKTNTTSFASHFRHFSSETNFSQRYFIFLPVFTLMLWLCSFLIVSIFVSLLLFVSWLSFVQRNIYTIYVRRRECDYDSLHAPSYNRFQQRSPSSTLVYIRQSFRRFLSVSVANFVETKRKIDHSFSFTSRSVDFR